MDVSDTFGSGEDRPAQRHVVAGCLACAVSIALHVAAFFFLSDVRFDVAVVSSDMLRKRSTRPMKVSDVRLSELPEVRRLEALRRQDPAVSRRLVEKAETLGRPPDEADIEPPPITESPLAGESSGIAEPSEVPSRRSWEPRQEIVMIEKRVVADDAGFFPRREIPSINRVVRAEDVAPEFDRQGVVKGDAVMPPAGGPVPGEAEITRTVAGGETGEEPDLVIDEGPAESGSELFKETAEEVTPFRPIEKLLVANVATYTSFRDRKYGYFKIEIERAGAEVLPVIPKDLVLVQDSSASMAEQRLYFCRQGLSKCLEVLGEDDRFNVVSFRDRAETCFDDWVDVSQDSIRAAAKFAGEMKSTGSTDIFSSIKDLLALSRTPGRPVIALLITDGLATTGLTDSSDIIGEFTKLNDGKISVFTMGTMQTANSYLLDLLAYCNKGAAFIVEKGRWDIPESMVRLMREVSRPVLGSLRLSFARVSECEVYPVLTSDLYLDRALVLYGRYPREMARVVFRASGRAGSLDCDMIFDLTLDKEAESGGKDIRTNWARQKIYHLIGEYARRAQPAIVEEIEHTSKAYHVRVPYRGKF